jgi:purine-binding chemotaxis protein CheW
MSAQSASTVSTYLTFGLGEEIFALEVVNVREVLDVTTLTRVPRMPEYMRGVINLRGSVVPVVDMRVKFGLPAAEDSVDTCIIVVEVDMDGEIVVVGALADSVKAVFDMKEEDIEAPPAMGTRLDTHFLKGMGKQDDTFIIILDANKVFSADELSIAVDIEQDQQSPEEAAPDA